MRNLSFLLACALAAAGCSSVPVTKDGKAVPGALSDAADAGKYGKVLKLLDLGADPNEVDKDGQTPLMQAAFWGHTKVARLLIERGARVDQAVPSFRFTALMKAAENGNTDTVRLLLEKGASIDAETMSGETALAFAAYDDQEATARFLLEKGASRDKAMAYLQKSAARIRNAARGLKMLQDMRR
ncbi:MAG: ankyrin repeat domain-containing protein [Elusimicrobiota bacterium]|jgi:ankyrin repeat protein